MHPSTRTAVVTGSDSPMGRAVALALADDGFHIGLAYAADRDSAESTAADIRSRSVNAAVQRMDLADLPDSAAAVDEFARELGGIGVLVSCPGSTAVECIQRAVRYMIASGEGGRIVNITPRRPGSADSPACSPPNWRDTRSPSTRSWCPQSNRTSHRPAPTTGKSPPSRRI